MTNSKPMQKTSPEISELKQQIEESVGRKMKTSNDFTFLSGAIWERTHENISTSTLKRLWGYVDGPDTTRNSTLDILSKFLGFKDWDGFLEHISQDNILHPGEMHIHHHPIWCGQSLLHFSAVCRF